VLSKDLISCILIEMTTLLKTLETKVPADLRKALTSIPNGNTLWKDLTQLARRDFITWIEQAKQEETRKRRIKIACDKLLKGDKRPCCYAVVPMNLYKALGATPKAKAMWSTLSANEKRDFVSFIHDAKEKEVRGIRIDKVCIILINGKRTV
jgi:uncharacterized protein YdeI (YjbR/CyaY-like superfamily)